MRKLYMDNKQVIPIFFAVDDGYIPFLAVSIQSLADHASDENQTFLIHLSSLL